MCKRLSSSPLTCALAGLVVWHAYASRPAVGAEDASQHGNNASSMGHGSKTDEGADRAVVRHETNASSTGGRGFKCICYRMKICEKKGQGKVRQRGLYYPQPYYDNYYDRNTVVPNSKNQEPHNPAEAERNGFNEWQEMDHCLKGNPGWQPRDPSCPEYCSQIFGSSYGAFKCQGSGGEQQCHLREVVHELRGDRVPCVKYTGSYRQIPPGRLFGCAFDETYCGLGETSFELEEYKTQAMCNR